LLQVFPNLTLPAPLVGARALGHPPHAQDGTRRGLQAGVEADEEWAGSRIHQPHAQCPDRLPDGGRPEPRAFEREKGQLFERIEHPELAIELEAIDHAQRRPEADVLRSQVPMAIADESFLGALREQRFPCGDEFLLQACNRTHACEQPLRTASGQQIVTIGSDARPEPPAILGTIGDARIRRFIEAAELGSQRRQLIRANRPSANEGVEHPCQRQAAHLDEPVDRLSGGTEPHLPIARTDQRDHFEIDAGCQGGVETELCPAHRAPGFQRQSIESVIAHRFAQLVCKALSQEHPREVRLDAFDDARLAEVAGIGKECQFLGS